MTADMQCREKVFSPLQFSPVFAFLVYVVDLQTIVTIKQRQLELKKAAFRRWIYL